MVTSYCDIAPSAAFNEVEIGEWQSAWSGAERSLKFSRGMAVNRDLKADPGYSDILIFFSKGNLLSPF